MMNESDDDLRLIERARGWGRRRRRRGAGPPSRPAVADGRGPPRSPGSGTGRPSDVLQDGFADAVAKLPGYLADPKLPLFLWLRLVVGERLTKIHRDHLGAQIRDASREVSLYRGPMPAASSAAPRRPPPRQGYVAHAGRRAGPNGLLRLQEALNALDPLDREILSLRHFEELTHAEAARVLDIGEAAAAKRYVRALKRLKDVLSPP